MSIIDEFQEYIDCWHELTGCPPSAIPMDSDDAKRFYIACKELIAWFAVTEPDSVPSFRGCDLYITEHAKQIRNQIIHYTTT